MNIKELRLKESAELEALLADLKKQFDDLNFKSHQGQLKNVREVRVVKQNIAQVLTALNEKKSVPVNEVSKQ